MACKYIIKVGSEFDNKLNLNLKKDKVIEENEAFLAINQYLDKARTEGKEVAKAVTQFGVETFGEGPTEFSASVVEEGLQNNYDSAVELAREQLNKITSLFINNFGRKPSFTDLLNILVYNNNEERVSNLFPVYVEAYRKDNTLSNKAEVNAHLEVFDVFDEVREKYLNLLDKQDLERPKQTAKEAEKIDNSVKENTENPEIAGFDTNNDPIKGKTPIQENTSEIKGVHISVPFTKDSEGEISDASTMLFSNKVVDNTLVLEPGKIKVGDKLQVRTMSPNTAIALYNTDGTIQRDENGNVVTMPFNLYASKKELVPGSKKYIEEMPVGIFVEGSDKPAMLLPSSKYFNSERESDSEKAKAFTEQIIATRNKLQSAEASGKVLELTVSEKTGGTFHTDGPSRTISELDVEVTPVITDSDDNLLNFKGEKVTRAENLKDGLVISEGYLTLLVKDANNEYRTLSATASNLSEQSIDSVVVANEIQTLSHLIKKYQAEPEFIKKLEDEIVKERIAKGLPDAAAKTIAKQSVGPLLNKIEALHKIQQDVLNTYKVDLLDKTQFRDYISKFTRLGEASPLNTSGNSLGLDTKTGKYIDSNTPAITAVKFLDDISNTLRSMMTEENSLVKQNLSIKENKKDVYPGNVKNFFNISKEGTVIEASYTDLIKSNFTTGLRTFKSPNSPDGKAYAFIQPTVKFKSEETLTKESQEQKKATQPRVEDKIIPTKPTQQPSEVLSDEALEAKLEESKEILSELGINPSNPAYVEINKLLGITYDIGTITEDVDKKEASSRVKNLKSTALAKLPLNIMEINQLTDYIFNILTENLILNSKISTGENLTKAKETFKDIIEKRKAHYNSFLETVEGYENIPNSIPLAIRQGLGKLETIENNWNTFEGLAVEKLLKYNGIKKTTGQDEQISELNQSNEYEKELGKSVLEVDPKMATSAELKMFLSNIKKTDKNGEAITGIFNVPISIPFDEVYDQLKRILNNPVDIDSDLNLVIEKLKSVKGKNKYWADQVVKKLESSDTPAYLKNQFMYDMIQHNMKSKFVMMKKYIPAELQGLPGVEPEYRYSIYDSNSLNPILSVQDAWKQEFRESALVELDKGLGKYVINKDQARKLYDAKYNKNAFKTKANLKNKDLNEEKIKFVQDLFLDFGIILDEGTVKEIIEDGSAEGIVNKFNNFLTSVVNKSSTVLAEEKSLSGLLDAGNLLKTLAKKELKYGEYNYSLSYTDGDKNVYGITLGKHATDINKKLKATDSKLRDDLLATTFNKNSVLLKGLQESAEFREKFFIEHMGLNALKEMGVSISGKDNSVVDFGEADQEAVKLALFMNTQQGRLGENRMARMFFPTMSDKSLMMHLTVPAFDFSAVELKGAEVGENVLTALMDQVVGPELERAYNFHHNIKAKGVTSNIKGYDAGAQMINTIPSLNAVTLKGNEDTNLAAALGSADYKTYEEFLSAYEGAIKDKLKSLVNNLTQKKLTEWNSYGLIKDNSNLKLDKTYMNSLADNDVSVAAKSFVVNSLIANQNINMAIAGDPALYSSGKLTDNKEKNKFFNNGNIGSPKNGVDSYIEASRDIVATNINKRMALLIAPGYQLANSRGKTYKQLFIEDHIDITSNADYLIDVFYPGNKNNKKFKTLIAGYRNNKDSETLGKIQDFANANYPNIAAYFDIEGTDAQEYTTMFEHITVLEGQGRIKDAAILASMKEKILQQRKSELRGEAIKEEHKFNEEELKLAYQPIKPVHTGFNKSEGADAMNMVYVKSSSFPLLPQLTQGTQLDKVRKLMEKMENDKNTAESLTLENLIPVRASYQTANKVGATAKGVQLFDQNGNFNESLNMDNALDMFTRTLSRENFRIQQDVPLKSAKKKEDLISEGTQPTKLLFGNGVMDLKGFQYKGREWDGKDLQEEFERQQIKLTKKAFEILNKRLGYVPGETIKDVKAFADNLQKVLIEEASGKEYSNQDLDALQLVLNTKIPINGKNIAADLTSEEYDYLLGNKANISEKTFNDLAKKLGEDTIDDILESDIEDFIVDNFEFKSPLWGSPNGVKYESLLNSIITNSISKYKMPGYSYVAGSEAGFKQISDIQSVKDFNKIIYTDNFNIGTANELQAANVVTDKNGNKTLKKAQVMLNPKLRDINGNVIDLWEKVNGNYTYLNVSEKGRLTLKEGVIDPTLLDLSSFRIPTSGHVSMAQIEVVGILPPSSGDLMVVPRNLTTQKGLDFDVDKENIYKKWTTLDSGKIRPISRKDSSRLTGMQKLKMDKKLIENDLVDIHTSVLSNISPEMQKKIQKVLSMDTAENQAAAIQQAISGVQEVDEDFTILSDSFQKSQIALGKAGKVAIGGYSNAVTLNSTANILTKKGTPLVIKMEEGSGTFKIGNIASDLALGKETTLEAKGFPKKVIERFRRTTADVLEERQNTATDNVKAMVMPKTNIDALTLNVDSLLSLLGFDMDFKRYTGIELRAEGNLNAVVDKDGKDVTKLEDIDDSAEYYRAVSIPYTLLSQPIIRKYVEIVNMANNIYNPKNLSQIKKDVVKFLKTIYKSQTEKKAGEDFKTDPSILTGNILFENLKKPDDLVQTTVLNLFLELDAAAGVVNGIQTNLKIDNGLGANFIEANQKAEYLSKLGAQKNEKFSVENSQALIGDFKTKEEYETLLDKDGYVHINGTYIKPTTTNGVRLVKSIEAYQDLFDNKTIYSKPAVDTILKRAPRLFGKGFLTGRALGDFQYRIFKEMKKYLFSNSTIGTFNLKEGQTKENKRDSLFYDTDNNTSLASYVRTILNNPSLPVKLKNNILLKSLTFDIQKGGANPSFINYSASKGEAFDQNQLNDALIELMEEPIVLDNYDGNEYTSYDLGRDLISYSYMDNGGVQEARQFNKLIPVNLLEEYGFSSAIRRLQKDEGALNLTLGFIPGLNDGVPSKFEEQLVINMAQDLPQTFKQKTVLSKDGTGKPVTFVVKDNREFLAETVLDSNKNTTYRVYKKDEGQDDGNKSFTYTYVGTKGNNRLPSYDPNSLKTKVKPSPTASLKESKNDTFNLQSENIEDILTAVSTYDNVGPKRQALAKELLTLVKGKGIKVSFKADTKIKSPAAYLFTENTIEFNSERLKNFPDRLLANGILHETVHALTGNQVSEFVNFDGTYKVGKSQVPKSLQNIVEMYKIAKEKVEKEVGMEASMLTNDYLKSKSYALTDNERKLYAVKDIHEFLTHTIAEVGDKQELFKGMKYENKNFIEKLLDYYKQLLKDIFGDETGNIAAQTTMETIKFIKEFKAPIGRSSNSSSSISSTLEAMDSKYGPIINKPKSSELSNSDKNTIFNDPLTGKCKL